MATTSLESTKDLTIIQLALIGALAGLAGGLLFGALMAIMAFLPMVGMLVGQESSLVGFIVHMAISAGIGAGYGVIAGRLNFGMDEPARAHSLWCGDCPGLYPSEQESCISPGKNCLSSESVEEEFNYNTSRSTNRSWPLPAKRSLFDRSRRSLPSLLLARI